jgi:hypothetical protein
MTAGLRVGAAGIAILGILQGCVSGESPAPARAGRIVVAVYTDVDGASFSTDGNVYARYTDFLDREECVRLSAGELTSLVASLDRTGFFAEIPRVPSRKTPSVPRAAFRICVASPGRSGECVFFCDKGLNVPAKYREIFAGLALPQRPAALDRFLKLNAECDN